MASATRAATRVLRPSQSVASLKHASYPHYVVPVRRTFRQQPRRGYTSSASTAYNSNAHCLYGGLAAALLGSGTFLSIKRPGTEAESALTQTDAEQGKVASETFVPNKDDYQAVYDAIAQRLIDKDGYDDGSYGPVVLRLGWHASGTYDAETGTGGSNGATMRFDPEGEHAANSGLRNAREFLEPIKERFPWISYSDLWTLAAACAVQEMGGPDIPWRPGRQDRDVSYCTPDGRLPDGAEGQNHLRAIFGRMGFNDQEIVALSGAHAVGRCRVDRSGFDGSWTFSPITMTNDFYKLLLQEKWHERDWKGLRQFQDDSTKTLMMLPSDMCLVEDQSFRPYVERYAADIDVFFDDFSEVVTKLFELGVPFTTDKSARMCFARTE